MSVNPGGAFAVGFPWLPIMASTISFGLDVEYATEHPSTELQSLKSVAGRLGLASNGLAVFAPLMLYPMVVHAADALTVNRMDAEPVLCATAQ
jgi:hypothetical protein